MHKNKLGCVTIMARRGNQQAGRGRYRRMYELTGLPGWVRFGSSPGFAGGGRGMGPCASYLQRTGQMSDFLADLQATNPQAANWSSFSLPEDISIEDERKVLSERIKLLEEELKNMKKRLKQLY